MVDTYTDVPGRRIAYDGDGTLVLQVKEQTNNVAAWAVPLNPLTEMTSVDADKINDEDSQSYIEYLPGTGNSGSLYVCLIFPELREIDGYYWSMYNQGGVSEANYLRESGNTTNGLDGTWTAIGSQVKDEVTDTAVPRPQDNYRDTITAAALSNKRAVMSLLASSSGGANSGQQRLYRFHVYGEISSGETPDRLLFIDEGTSLEFGAATAPEAMDWGDRPRGSAKQWEFRLKNNSTTAGNNLTANTISVAAEALYLTSNTYYTLSTNGTTFTSSINITSIAPEADSGKLYARQIIPETAALALHAARLKAAVSSWT